MALTAVLAGHAQGDALVQQAVVADDGGAADDHAHAVVDGEVTTDRRGGVDVRGKPPVRALGHKQRELVHAVLPQPVVRAVRPHDVRASGEEHDVRERLCRGVAGKCRLRVLTHLGEKGRALLAQALGGGHLGDGRGGREAH